ncbi:MAG: NADH-quinone oxidoreductase subunit N [Candidatus Zixiibacteriota bacterium]
MESFSLKGANLDFGLLAPEITLAVAGFVILLLGVTRRGKAYSFAIGTTALTLALWLAVEQWDKNGSGFFGMVSRDNFSALYNFIFLLSGVITFLISRSYLRAREIERPEYYALTLFSIMGMMVMASSFDLILIFLGLEIMSLPLYVMAGLDQKNPKSNEAAIKYFIMGAFASGFLLYGIALIYGAAATTDLSLVAANFISVAESSPWMLYGGAALALVGFAFKVAAVPFHMWAPDVYQGAPTPVTAFFSVGPKAAGFAALMRIFVFGFGQMDIIEPLLWTLAALTMIVGNLLALKQSNIKRMLAYSSIAHAGYILVALTVGGKSAVASGMYYLMSYMFFNLGAFAILTALDTRAGTDSRFDEINGMAIRHPYLATLLALFMFSLAGFPPTAGFFAKFYVFKEAINAEFIWLAIIGVMASFVSVYYYLKVVVYSFFNKVDRPFAQVSLNPLMIAALIITAAGALGLGIFPANWVEISESALF